MLGLSSNKASKSFLPTAPQSTFAVGCVLNDVDETWLLLWVGCPVPSVFDGDVSASLSPFRSLHLLDAFLPLGHGISS